MPPPFTEVPSDPTFAAVGSIARLKWNFLIHGSFSHVRINYWKSDIHVPLMDKYKGGKIAKNPRIPSSFTNRITIEENATFVISTVNKGDATRYSCVFYPLSGPQSQEVPVQLIVTGEMFQYFQ